MSAVVTGSSDPIVATGHAVKFVNPLPIVKDMEKFKCFFSAFTLSASLSIPHVPG
jgi:hypothetical protein